MGRLESHGKPLDRRPRAELELTGGLQQALGTGQAAGQVQQISRWLARGLQLLGEPQLGLSSGEDAFSDAGLKHHVMIKLAQQGI